MTLIGDSASALARFPARAQIFLPGGRQPEVGQTICRPAFARTLRQIASEGAETLYTGALARTIVADMCANGGLISLDDVAEYRVIERTPVRGEYRGYEIVSTAPPSSGGTHIVDMLNLLSGFAVGGKGLEFGTTAYVHLLAECFKIAFADRRAYMAGKIAFADRRAYMAGKIAFADRRAYMNPNIHDTKCKVGRTFARGSARTR